MGTARFLLALVATNLRAAAGHRGAFWLQAGLMFGNNLIFFVFWWLLLRRVDSLGGWRLPDLATLYGIVAGAYGTSVLLGGGARNLARTIDDGGLDALLVHPKPVLLHAVGSHAEASGVGDLASSVLLLAWSGHASGVGGVALAILFAVCGALVLTSAGILAHSLAFWCGPINAFARQVWEYLITLSVYPASIWPLPLRTLAVLAIPSGVVGTLPAEALRAPSAGAVTIVVAATVAWTALAVFVFHRGLRAYASGSRFVGRG